jgi:hypothetical protein
MDLISVVLSTEIGVAAAVPALIIFGSAVRAVAGRAGGTLERRLWSRRRWS